MLLDPCTLYAHEVLAGREIAGPWVRASCKRHLDDLASGKERGLWFDVPAAVHVFGFFQEALRLSDGQFEGREFKLHPSQCFILGSIYGWKRRNDQGDVVRRFRRAYIEAAKGNGKDLAIDTLIPTPNGWCTMGNLQPGDVVFDDAGKPTTILAVSGHMHDQPCFRVRFNDGSSVIAGAGHLWKTAALRTGLTRGLKAADAPRKGGYAIRTTAEIARTLTTGISTSLHPQSKWNHRVDVAGALDLPDVDLPVPPYTFGAWLGDGDSDRARLTVAYDDWGIVRSIEAEGIQCREQIRHSDTTARVALGSSGRAGARASKLQTKLRGLGVIGRKHIPMIYLRASIDQRMKLLQGLMDTDGTALKGGQCELTLCSSGLADDAIELIASLGLKPTRSISEAKLNGKVVGWRHRIQFWAYADNPAFQLARKAVRLRAAPKTRSISQGRMIIGCDPVPTVLTQCISVDAPSQMFLCGRQMIPTHNSPMVGGMGLYGMVADNEPGAQIYSAGATFDQASILFNDAVKMAQQSEAIWDLITPSGNAKILNLAALGPPHNGSFFRPLSREKSKTGSGPRPHMALCDELHEHKDGGVMDMLERGFKFRRQPLMIMITNSGSDRKSICWEEHQHAIKVASGQIEDDTLFSYVCALDEGDDPLTDESCWKKANPLLGTILTNEYLRGVVRQANDLPSKQNNILRLHFCQWTDAATAWIGRHHIEACEDVSITLDQMEGCRFWAGLDLSAVKDLTALAMLFEDGYKDVPDPENPGMTKRKPCYALFVKSFTPEETLAEREKSDKTPYRVWVRDGHLTTTPGPKIRYDFVAASLIEMAQRFDLVGMAYDNWMFRQFADELAEQGGGHFPVHDHPQGISRRQDSDIWMPGSVDAFETLILERRIRIQVNPVLRAAIAGATFWEAPSGLKRFDKAKATNRIDPCVAAAMACGLATLGDDQNQGSVYERISRSGVKVADSGEIDYDILNDAAHPQHANMLRRFYRKQDRDDAHEGAYG